jgi:hypothetical protein
MEFSSTSQTFVLFYLFIYLFIYSLFKYLFSVTQDCITSN